MGSAERRRLIVTADDFGLSESINHAVIQAHQNGILTCASLMVNGPAFDHAVELARANPTLGVGLHLALCDRQPVLAGCKFFFFGRAKLELRREIAAQFAKFQCTGLPLDHLNGHLHFHLHPTVLRTLFSKPREWKIPACRLTRPSPRIEWPLGRGRWLYRSTHVLIFGLLSRWARGYLLKQRVPHPALIFGLLENERVDERYLLDLLDRLPPGDSEVYSHPSLDHFRHEYEALVCPEVREKARVKGIELIRYQDL